MKLRIVLAVTVLLAVAGCGLYIRSCDRGTDRVKRFTPETAVPASAGQTPLVPAPSYPATPTAHTYKEPQKQYDQNMTAAEEYCEARNGVPLPVDHPVILAVRDALTRMEKRGYRVKLVRAKGARLINYYHWARIDYDKKSERLLRSVAKQTGCKYREPRYWQFGREKGWW